MRLIVTGLEWSLPETCDSRDFTMGIKSLEENSRGNVYNSLTSRSKWFWVREGALTNQRNVVTSWKAESKQARTTRCKAGREPSPGGFKVSRGFILGYAA